MFSQITLASQSSVPVSLLDCRTHILASHQSRLQIYDIFMLFIPLFLARALALPLIQHRQIIAFNIWKNNTAFKKRFLRQQQIDFKHWRCCINNPVACKVIKMMFIDKLLCLTKTPRKKKPLHFKLPFSVLHVFIPRIYIFNS